MTPAWEREVWQLLEKGFKMEVEPWITLEISCATEVYAPNRL